MKVANVKLQAMLMCQLEVMESTPRNFEECGQDNSHGTKSSLQMYGHQMQVQM